MTGRASKSDSESTPTTPRLPAWQWRVAISGFVIFHLWGILGRPVEFVTQGPMGPSPVARALYAPIRPYSEFFYFNHGYAFFAPNPGPSHLISINKVDKTGQRIRQTVPDLKDQWPRLLYHRHFMLSEFLNNIYAPPKPPEGLTNTRLVQSWRTDRDRYETIRDSMRNHVQWVDSLDSIERIHIERIEHRMPDLNEFLEERVRLTNPRLYRTLPDTMPTDLQPSDQGPPNIHPSPLIPSAIPTNQPPILVPPGPIHPEPQ